MVRECGESAAMNETGSASNMPRITSTSVKVMRSHDYCHFEVVLGTTSEHHITIEEVDALRKAAARLADKAVLQYKVAKAAIAKRERASGSLVWLAKEAEEAQATPENERSPEQKAQIKAHADAVFHANHSYDYEEDWNDPEERDGY